MKMTGLLFCLCDMGQGCAEQAWRFQSSDLRVIPRCLVSLLHLRRE